MKRLTLLLTLALLLSACGLRPAATPSPQKGLESPPAATMLIPEASMARGAPSDTITFQAAAPAQNDRLVIQNVSLNLVVSDVEKKMESIASLAQTMGGFVVSSSLYKVTTPAGVEAPQGEITIRVPATRLSEALGQIKQQVVEVRDERRTGQDVTREYVDLKARLRNLEAAEQQLMQIMQKAEKTEDVMNVFNQLMSVREQIEQVKGQIQYYEESAALSAISITLIAEETVKPLEIGGWKPKGVARDALQSLIYFFQGLVNFLIRFFLYYLWVILLAIVLPLWLLWRLGWFVFRRLRKNQNVTAEAAPREH